MDKINQLFSLCGNMVSITYNDHKSIYETVEEYFVDAYNGEERAEIPDEVFAEMVRRDTIICVHYCPGPGTGFNLSWHYDLEQAVDQALAELTSTESPYKPLPPSPPPARIIKEGHTPPAPPNSYRF